MRATFYIHQTSAVCADMCACHCMHQMDKTDSQALKECEIQGFVKKWQHANFLLHLAMYLDILTPLKVLSVTMQQE